MHQSSMEKMAAFKDRHLSGREEEPLSILDLGSMDINGSYRPLFTGQSWNYRGLDLSPGENVDVVLENPYHWPELLSNSADVFISGQAFEHIEFFWITILEIARVLKPEGLCCLIAPSGGFEHRYPVDCWRFFPDGFRALAKFGQLAVLQTSTQWEPNPNYVSDDSNLWRDTMLVCAKPPQPFWAKLKQSLVRRFLRRLLAMQVG